MNILYTKKFSKDINVIQNDPNVKNRLLDLIKQIKTVHTLSDIPGVKKIEGYTGYFRFRIGDYRLGVKLNDNGLEMIRFLHRKDIYRKFP